MIVRRHESSLFRANFWAMFAPRDLSLAREGEKYA
jgi:hypothetical protein